MTTRQMIDELNAFEREMETAQYWANLDAEIEADREREMETGSAIESNSPKAEPDDHWTPRSRDAAMILPKSFDDEDGMIWA